MLLIASNGLVRDNNRTLPYGELWSLQTASATTKKYTSYERDQETGLDYAINRYFSNAYGRFVSSDKGSAVLYTPKSLNRYAYAADDPVNHVDPTGDQYRLIISVTDRAPEPEPEPAEIMKSEPPFERSSEETSRRVGGGLRRNWRTLWDSYYSSMTQKQSHYSKEPAFTHSQISTTIEFGSMPM